MRGILNNAIPLKTKTKADLKEFLIQERYYLENDNFDYLFDVKIFDLTMDSVVAIEVNILYFLLKFLVFHLNS